MLGPEDKRSDDMSIMSVDNDDQDMTSWSVEGDHSGNASSHDRSEHEWVHPDSRDFISQDFENLEALNPERASSAEQPVSPRVNDDNVRMVLDEAAIIDMIQDPPRCLDDATRLFDFSDENISIDEDEDEDDYVDFPMRSCTTRKGINLNAGCVEKESLSSSWVMIQMKQKPMTKKSSKVRNRVYLDCKLRLND
jgi:hypothetical protein